MKNWKDYVGFQPAGPEPRDPFTGVMLFYLDSGYTKGETSDWPVQIEISIKKVAIVPEEFIISEDHIGDVVQSTLKLFPVIETSNVYERDRERTRVAMNTRRGAANTNFGTTWFYRGNSMFDQPIMVTEYKSKYAIWRHPKFSDYGFNTKGTP